MGKSKIAVIDITAFSALIIVLVTGIILHLKKHGLLIEPRSVIKVIHWCAGYIFVIMASWHFAIHKKWLGMIHAKQPLYWALLVSLPALVLLTFGTGTVKLLVHGIRGLGMWHYWLGLIMSAALVLHISKALPYLLRSLRKS